ncbi:deoxyribodipyrimidine photo-lyase [Arcticibacter pallidicorallinus]|uniref:Deoxyribodipyrimidine photo-lyase n=2 Tax=Arcticibacter pallidicorallinus TaxID=1259464 RepID=A0A2T0TW33_9SPHI|nr:deoxyribodipyrimidine photo-lyase [Arcticibacter pallidicorallinus]
MIFMDKQVVNVFWFRRDLRIDDNTALSKALQSGLPVLPVFIFDPLILDKLEDREDARVSFIYKSLQAINQQLNKLGSSLLVLHQKPLEAWQHLSNIYHIDTVFTNSDYEPYARSRDEAVAKLLKSRSVNFSEYKDHVIFEKDEILKSTREPYTVFTPYKNKWLEKFLADEYSLKSSTSAAERRNFFKCRYPLPDLETFGFKPSSLQIPVIKYENINKTYAETRDIPSIEGTARTSVHLRFGTISIREVASHALQNNAHTWLSELIWRDFYFMIIWHFPETVDHAFKRAYDNIRWRNDEQEFKAWCAGKTGYPIIDAGMRQLNTTGWMHNRVRMVTASFLCKHLLIDWRWGEAYFAKKLLDYDLASNVGGWQWAAGSGNDAAPYFRIFNPELQMKKFDPQLRYVRQWVKEYDDAFAYPQPIVDHKEARARVLTEYKRALAEP